MRCWIVALAVVAPACGQNVAPAPGDGAHAPAGASATIAVPVDPTALGGQWAFDRSCGLYDLVFTNGDVSYYDYSDAAMAVSYAGAWAIDAQRVSLALRRLDSEANPRGETLNYVLEVKAPITNDLAAEFGREGETPHAINARRCELEDRE